jgi:hypothetical protein
MVRPGRGALYWGRESFNRCSHNDGWRIGIVSTVRVDKEVKGTNEGTVHTGVELEVKRERCSRVMKCRAEKQTPPAQCAHH